MNVIPTMIKIFMPSSRIISSSWAMGAAMTESITLKFTPSISAMNQSIGLVFTHVP